MVSAAAVDFMGSQVGDVAMGDVAGGDVYKGLPPEELLELLADAIQDERQYRRLSDAAQDVRHDQVDRQLKRIDLVLQRVALILALQAGVLTLLLIAALILIGALLSPHLLAVAAVAGAGLFRLVAGASHG